ncbi:hypothetical protein BHM03_00042916 [Ensete ventricosum]|nr:hypothetical protein BHM03_00042916 [Ensete ventricosum]
MAAEYHCCEANFFIHILIIALLVLFAGLMSGLTLGLMSLSLVDLEVLAKSGTPQDSKHAGTLYLCSHVSLSQILDYLLGDGHVALFRRAELKTLVKNLLSIHPDDEVPVRNVTIRKIPRYLLN